MIQLDAFRINRHESVLTTGTLRAGTNLLTNPSFETGAFGAGWATTTDSAVVGASLVESADGNYVAQLGALGAPEAPRLESARVAVTAGTKYMFAFRYGMNLAGGTTGDRYLTAKIRWWTASSGGSELSNNVAYQQIVASAADIMRYAIITIKAPASATYASVRFEVNFDSTAGGPMVCVDDVLFAAMVTVTRPNLIESLAHWQTRGPRGFSQLLYATNARTGFGEQTFRVHGDPAYLWDWLVNAPGQHIEPYFENVRVGEGFVHTVRGRINGVPWSTSYDTLYNDIVLDFFNNQRERTQNADSIRRYGRKQLLEQNENILGREQARGRVRLLNKRYGTPKPISADDVSADGGNYVDVTVSPYWDTLQYIETVTVWFAYGADTSVLIATGDVPTDNRSVLETVRDLYGNLWISNDYGRVATTGNIVRFEGGGEQKRTGNAQDILLDLINLGDSNNRFLVSGVWENRQFVLQARPTTAGYFTETVDGAIVYRAASGARVPNPLVRAGQYRKQVRPVPSQTAYADIDNDPAALFLWNVQYDTENDTVTVTPPDADTLAAGLARAVGWSKI